MVGQSRPRQGEAFAMIYRYISLYIMCFLDLECYYKLRYDFVLPTLHHSFTDPASPFYRPCILLLPALHPPSCKVPLDGVFCFL